MAIVTATVAKTYMSITSSSEDTLITALATYADAAVKSYCGLDFESTTYPGAASGSTGDAGYYSGDGGKLLVLKQRPVSAISAIYLDPTGRFGYNPDGAFDATTTVLTAGTDYALRKDGCLPGTTTQVSYSGIVERINGTWPSLRYWQLGQITAVERPTPGNIKVAYTAGWSAVPPDVVAAACQLVAFMRRNAKKGGPIQSESLGGYSYSMASLMGAPELGTARQLLARYREVRFR